MAARGRGLFSLYYLYRKLKKSSYQKPLTRFPYNFAEMFLWLPSSKIVQAIWICQKNIADRGRGSFCLYIYMENLKKSSCQKPLNRFPYNFAEMFLWWSSTQIVQAIWICQKTWPPGAGLIFPIYLYRKLKKNLFVRNHWIDCYLILQKCSFGDSVQRLFKPFGFVKKHGRKGAGLIFPIYLYRKFEKSYL